MKPYGDTATHQFEYLTSKRPITPNVDRVMDELKLSDIVGVNENGTIT